MTDKERLKRKLKGPIRCHNCFYEYSCAPIANPDECVLFIAIGDFPEDIRGKK